jgi:hypothetical protein
MHPERENPVSFQLRLLDKKVMNQFYGKDKEN